MNTPNEVMVRFGCRKNYIGQLEILAAVAVYFSMPELRGRRVLHLKAAVHCLGTIMFDGTHHGRLRSGLQVVSDIPGAVHTENAREFFDRFFCID